MLLEKFFREKEGIRFISFRGKQFVFIIDEYACLEEAFPETPSILQKYIDLYRERGKLFLVLCSSSRSFMETKVMGQGSPLYGRRDISLEPGPFGTSGTGEMLPLLKNDGDIFKVRAITGGFLCIFHALLHIQTPMKL